MKIQKISKLASQSLKRQNGTVAKCFVYGGDGLWAQSEPSELNQYHIREGFLGNGKM